MNSHRPSPRNSSSCSSARRQMNASLSFSRFGVISRISRRPLAGVVGRVHRHHVLVHRQLVPVAIDDVTDVVALQGHREGGERADDRVARRERLVVPVDLGRLVVAGHRHHPEVGERQDRAFRAELLEVRVGILDQRLVEEEVGRLPVAQARVSFVPMLRTCTAMLSNCLAPVSPLWQGSRRDLGPLAPPHRRRGLQDPRPAARRGRTAAAGGGLRRRHLAAGGGQGGPQAAARPLLLPHHGRPLPGGVPAPGRRERGASGTGDRRGRIAAGRSGSSTPIPGGRGSTSSSWPWPTTARRSAPRSPATPSGSGPPSSRP